MPPYGPNELPAPVPSNEPLDDLAAGCAAFLRIADGAACGSSGEIRLWPAAAVRQLQSVTDNLPGAGERWCAVADVMQNPVLVEYATGEVWWFYDLNIVWYTDTQQSSFAKLADDISGFIDYLVLGPGFAEHIATEPGDPWLQALSNPR